MLTWEWVAGALVLGFTVGSIFGARFGVRRDAHGPCDELPAYPCALLIGGYHLSRERHGAATEDEAMTRMAQVGSWIVAGRGEDRDAGKIVSIDGDVAVVAWESGVRTPCTLDAHVEVYSSRSEAMCAYEAQS